MTTGRSSFAMLLSSGLPAVIGYLLGQGSCSLKMYSGAPVEEKTSPMADSHCHGLAWHPHTGSIDLVTVLFAASWW